MPLDVSDLCWRMRAEPCAVAEARRAVAALAQRCGAGDEDVARVRLAVSEAVANAVVHAYAGEPSGDVEVEAIHADHALDVVVRDFGHGMKPRPDSPGLGLGLPLIAQSTDELDVHCNDVTIVQMHFQFAA